MNQPYFALSLLLLAMAGPMLAIGRVSNQTQCEFIVRQSRNQSSLTLRVGHAAPDSESQATSFAESRPMTTAVRVVDNITGDVDSEIVTADTLIYLVSRTIEIDDELAEEMIDETLQTISGSIFDVLDVLSPTWQRTHVDRGGTVSMTCLAGCAGRDLSTQGSSDVLKPSSAYGMWHAVQPELR